MCGEIVCRGVNVILTARPPLPVDTHLTILAFDDPRGVERANRENYCTCYGEEVVDNDIDARLITPS